MSGLTIYGTGKVSTEKIMKGFSRALKSRFETIDSFRNRPGRLPHGTKEVMILGVLRGTAHVYKYCQNARVPFYYLDNPYFVIGNIKDYLRVSKEKFCRNTLGDFPDDRLKDFNINIEDWNTNRGDSILVIPPTHAMCWFFDQKNWLADTISEIRKYTDRSIIIRHKPHNPLINHRTHYPIAEISPKNDYITPLSEDLMKAHCVVTFNSNSAIQALQAGIPIICNEQCSAYPLTNKFEDIENLTLHDNRQQLFNTLSYSQFSQNEIKAGLFYNHC